ncbi:hypothetical protein L6452_04617 [Arctium lappa]|uniref:Uncharacterized protein n=1 Tax=Arctium lappa TaxID=4217 RepID=A0ACB9EDS4_ARCLA|nr:hypothetical protein L6452_04617 [Arctium lappa]
MHVNSCTSVICALYLLSTTSPPLLLHNPKVWWYRVGAAGLMIDQQQISRGWLSLAGECSKERFLYWSNDALYVGESEAAQGSVSCLVLVCLRGCSR